MRPSLLCRGTWVVCATAIACGQGGTSAWTGSAEGGTPAIGAAEGGASGAGASRGPDAQGGAPRDASSGDAGGASSSSGAGSASGVPGDAGRGGSSGGASSGADAGSGSGGDGGGAVAPGREAGTGEGAVPGAGVSVFPAPGARGVCPDPPLRITFSGAPTLGAAGKIQVFQTGQAAPVAVVDMGAASYSDTIGGTAFNLVRPVYVDDNDAVVYLKSHALAYGQTYYVTVDSGAIVGPGRATFSISDTSTWRFSTAAAAPSSLSALQVALDGSGDFCSVQGAIDAIPARNSAAVTIAIASGTYHEIVHSASKNNVTLLGQDRHATVISGTNNNNLNPTTSTRSLVGIDSSSGIVIDTLTIANSTPQGGTQAEALRLESCDECVVRNADITSLQDTVLWSGRVYAQNCLIAGNVDFVWGTGTAYFKDCEIRTVGRAGAVVQARNTAASYGYVFVDSTLTADPGVTGQVLARIDVSAYPDSQVAYINCTMGSFIAPAGWTITGGTDTSALRFWEFQSVDSAGNAIDVSKRVSGSTQISAAQATSLRDPTVVLSGWQPPP